MRVLMLTQFYAPVVGGEERLVQDLSHALVRRGHDVSVATLHHDGLPTFERAHGVRIHRLTGALQRIGGLFSAAERPHAPPFPDPQLTRQLRRVIHAERPHVLHAHNWLVHSALPLKQHSGAPLAVSLHDYSLTCANKRLMQKETVPCAGPELRKCVGCASAQYGPVKGIPTVLSVRAAAPLLRKHVDVFLPVSHAAAAGNGLLGADARFEIVPNFMPNPEPGPGERVQSDLDDLPEPGFLLYVGDLTWDKGTDVLLEAYAQLRAAPPLVMIGRPFGRTSEAVGGNVRLLGTRSHATVLEAARRCAIAIVPSIYREPFGLVALEAMSQGRPLVAARSGFLEELVVDGQTGLLTRPNDPKELAHALERLLSDAALRETMGAAAGERALEFAEDRVVPRVEHIYRSITGYAEGPAACRRSRN